MRKNWLTFALPGLKIFYIYMTLKKYPIRARTESRLEVEIPEASLIIAIFGMFYIRVFSHSTGLVLNRYDYMRFVVRL